MGQVSKPKPHGCVPFCNSPEPIPPTPLSIVPSSMLLLDLLADGGDRALVVSMTDNDEGVVYRYRPSFGGGGREVFGFYYYYYYNRSLGFLWVTGRKWWMAC